MAIKDKRKFTTSKDTFNVFGTAGESLFSSFRDEEINNDDRTLEDYRRMIDNDGQMQMLYSAIVGTILSAGFTLMDDESIPQEQTSREKEFIDEMLFTPPHKGGMRSSFELTNRRMLRTLIEGFRVFEPVYERGADGLIHLVDLAPRAGRTFREFTLAADDNGNFIGFNQRASFKNEWIDVEVRNEKNMPRKAVKATFGEEFGSLYGRSLFRAAWYHYDKAHKGMYLNHVGHELGAVKFRHVKTKVQDKDGSRTSQFVEDLKRVGLESIVAYNENDFELIFEDVSDAGVMEQGKDMIKLHYSMISKSVLAQFVDLGSSVSDTGSRSLGDTMVSFFKQGLQSIGEIVLENTWNTVIADMVRINFNNGLFPKLVLNPISDEAAEILLEGFQKLIEKGEITESIKKELLLKTTDKLDLDVTEEDIEEDFENKNREAEQQRQFDLEKARMTVQQFGGNRAQIQNSDVQLQDEALTEGFPQRELFPDEEKVRLTDIKRKLQDSEETAKRVLGSKLTRQRDEIVSEMIRAMREGRKAIKSVDIKLQDEAPYSEELEMIALEILDFGKVTAANELKKASAPQTPRGVINDAKVNIQLVVEEQESRLKFRLQKLANDLLRRDTPENEARIAIEQEYDTFFNSVLDPTVNSVLPEYMNNGRQITFDRFQNEIFAFRYTAVIDNRTTDYCLALDGRVFQKNDPQFALRTPPQHFGCRSIWTPITNDEQDLFNFTVNGAPSRLPTFSSLSGFRDVDPTELKDDSKQIALIEHEANLLMAEINSKLTG